LSRLCALARLKAKNELVTLKINIMKKLVTFIAIIFLSVSVFAQTQWKVDPFHSSLNFNISHSGISIVNGKFLDYSGTLTTNGEALTNASFNFEVDIASINTNVEDRDNHLRSADFFDAEKYPKMTFKSTKILATGKPNSYLLYGELTIKNVTKDVIFNVHYGGTVKNQQGEKLGMKAETTINRFDYNIDYDPTAAGIGKEVNIVVHLQFAKQ
jgi:polyisoprenoid-binding protein YceI